MSLQQVADPNAMALKDVVGVVQGVVTILAILIGGVWTWILYRQKRQRFPHAGVTHEVFTYALSDGRRLLRLGICIENKGEVLVKIVGGEARVQQIKPVDVIVREEVDTGQFKSCRGLEVGWPGLGTRSWNVEGASPDQDDGLLKQIEPHERDTVHIDFVLDDRDAEAVIVYSYVRNIAKRRHWWAPWLKKDIGWRTETIHELPMMNKQHEPRATTTEVKGGTPLQSGRKPATQIKPVAVGPTSSGGGDATKQAGPKAPPPTKPPATKSR